MTCEGLLPRYESVRITAIAHAAFLKHGFDAVVVMVMIMMIMMMMMMMMMTMTTTSAGASPDVVPLVLLAACHKAAAAQRAVAAPTREADEQQLTDIKHVATHLKGLGLGLRVEGLGLKV